MKNTFLFIVLFAIYFSSCNEDDNNLQTENDTIISSDDKTSSEEETVNFNEFLALFEEIIPNGEEYITLPPNDYFFKTKDLKDRLIPEKFLKLIDFKSKEFNKFSNKTGIHQFSESFREESQFYAILKFKAFDNCNTVIVYNKLDEIPDVRTECSYYFFINFNDSGKILSVHQGAYLYIDHVNYLKHSYYTYIFLADMITSVSQTLHMRHGWQKEFISEYAIQKDGSIKQTVNEKEYLETFSKEWTKITEENGERFIQEYCDASPVKFIISKGEYEYFLNAIWGQDGDKYEILAFQSDPYDREQFKFILKNLFDNKEIEVSFRYDDQEKACALWKGLLNDEFVCFASKEYVDSGSIRVRKPDCDEEP